MGFENATVHIGSSVDEAKLKAANELSNTLHELKSKGVPALLLSSGGSALDVLECVSDECLGKFLTVGVLDERYDPTNTNNNFSQLARTSFFEAARTADCTFFDTRIQTGETFKQFTERFGVLIEEWLTTNPQGVIVATIGMGPDGHISGIMPFPENPEYFYDQFMTEKLVAGYDAGQKTPFPLRATTTLTFLKKITHPIIFITGSQKSSALNRAQTEGDYATVPARFLRELVGASLCVDQDLASDAGL